MEHIVIVPTAEAARWIVLRLDALPSDVLVGLGVFRVNGRYYIYANIERPTDHHLRLLEAATFGATPTDLSLEDLFRMGPTAVATGPAPVILAALRAFA